MHTQKAAPGLFMEQTTIKGRFLRCVGISLVCCINYLLSFFHIASSQLLAQLIPIQLQLLATLSTKHQLLRTQLLQPMLLQQLQSQQQGLLRQLLQLLQQLLLMEAILQHTQLQIMVIHRGSKKLHHHHHLSLHRTTR